jgi:ABC-type multidrug transport system fused ATPase/permease subunit
LSSSATTSKQFQVHGGEGATGSAVTSAINRLRRASTKMQEIPSQPPISTKEDDDDVNLPTDTVEAITPFLLGKPSVSQLLQSGPITFDKVSFKYSSDTNKPFDDDFSSSSYA